MAQGHSSILMQDLSPIRSNGTYDTRIENGELYGKPKITVDSLNIRSWIVAVLMFGMCPGSWVLAVFSKYLGRKKILIMSMSLFFLTSITLVFSNDAYQILISRSLFGFSAGISAGLVPVYQGECALPELRAALNVLHSTSVSLGIGICHALGIWFHWRTIALFTGLISIVTMILCFNIVESPIWLLKKRRFRAAVKSWTYWRGTQDLDELKSMYDDSTGYSSKNANREKHFCSPGFWKPLGIIMMFFTVTQLSGMGAVTHYCIQMITDITGSDRAYIPTLILDTFRFVSSLTSTFFTKRYGPRTVALWSATTTAFLLISLSLVMLLNLQNSWFALMLLFAFEAAVVTGLLCLPWSFCSELFSTRHKEVGIGISNSYNFVLFFLVLKFNPNLVLELQAWGTFLFYGICTSVGSIILYFILPDTKNKSLKEIELMFYNK